MWSHCPTSISYFSGLVLLGPCCRIALDIYLNIGTTKSLPQQIQMWPPPGAFTEHFIPVWQGAGELKGLGNPRILAGIFDLEPNRDEIRTSHCLIRRSWCLMLIRGKKKKKKSGVLWEARGAAINEIWTQSRHVDVRASISLPVEWLWFSNPKQKGWKVGEMRVISDS